MLLLDASDAVDAIADTRGLDRTSHRCGPPCRASDTYSTGHMSAAPLTRRSSTRRSICCVMDSDIASPVTISNSAAVALSFARHHGVLCSLTPYNDSTRMDTDIWPDRRGSGAGRLVRRVRHAQPEPSPEPRSPPTPETDRRTARCGPAQHEIVASAECAGTARISSSTAPIRLPHEGTSSLRHAQ